MKNQIFNIFAYILFFVFFNCSTTSQWNNNVHLPNNLPTIEKYPNAGAFILLDEANLDINNSDNFAYSTLERHRIVKILNRRGHKYANVTIPYSSTTDISDVNARTITPEGDIISLKLENIYEVTLYPSFVFYSDIKAKKFTIPGVEDGCIVEYKWKKTVPNFTYWDRWSFQNDDPTLISRYKVLAPSEWELKSKPNEIDIEVKTENLPAGFKQTYLWEAKNIEAFEYEPMMPPISRSIKSVLFSPIGMETWQKLENWYVNLLGERHRSTSKIKEFTDNLVQDCTTPLQKLERIFKFARDNIRYVSISIGIGGYQPHFAEEVLHNRYGDCKDKATLLSAMAQSQDIDVELVLISTAQNGLVDTTITSHVQFNHVISKATISDSIIWMDATEVFCPFGQLPWYDSDRLVVVVNPNKDPIWFKTPEMNRQKNTSEKKWLLEINKSKIESGSFRAIFSGASAMQMRKYFQNMNQKQINTRLSKDILVRFPNARIDSILIDNIGKVDSSFSYSIKFNTNLKEEKTLHSFSYSIFNRFPLGITFTKTSRNFPIVFHFPYIENESIVFLFNRKAIIKQIPKTKTVSNDYFVYKSYVEKSANKVHFKRSFQLKTKSVQPNEYQHFRDALNQISLNDLQNIIFQ
jgi:cellulose synthase operon protein C